MSLVRVQPPAQFYAIMSPLFIIYDKMEYLLNYCITDRQTEIVKAVIEHGSCRKAASALKSSKSSITTTFNRIKKRAASDGVAPEKDLYYPLPKGQIITGTSTLQRSPAGNLQWIKTKSDAQAQIEMMREAIDALVSDIRPVDAVENNSQCNDDLITVYPIGDPHVGMRAFGEECGADWDMVIAEKVFKNVFGRLIAAAPSSTEAVIVNLGDFMHSDNMAGVTERSGHSLDMDGRYPKVIGVAMRIIRRIIHAALEKHQNVRVINAIGNHDDTGAMWLSVALTHIYENEPRVVIDSSPTPFHYVKFGKVLIGAHHGHTCKADKLPLVMATDMAKEWGETESRYWLTGHIHHDTLKEYPGVKVESFRTLAAKDAYATWNGYRSGQDSKCIVYHKDFGEVERHTVNIGMVKNN